MCRLRFIIPAKLPDIRIEAAIEEHHWSVQTEFNDHFDAKDCDPTVQEISDWLLLSRTLVPWVSSIGSVCRASLSKAADELDVTLPARQCDEFRHHLATKVIEWVCETQSVEHYRRIEPHNRPLRISYKNYGAAVGPNGRTIKNVFATNAKLVWSTSRSHALDGVFEFWVPQRHWSIELERRAENAYVKIDTAAPR